MPRPQKQVGRPAVNGAVGAPSVTARMTTRLVSGAKQPIQAASTIRARQYAATKPPASRTTSRASRSTLPQVATNVEDKSEEAEAYSVSSSPAPDNNMAAATDAKQSDLIAQFLAGLASTFSQGPKPAIATFSGQSDVVIWADEYEKMARASNWTEEIMIKRLRFHLAGVALTWMQATEQSDQNATIDWPTLKADLVDAFRPKTYDMDQRREAGRHINRDEDVMTYFEAKRLVCARIGMAERDTIAAIMTGLPSFHYNKLAAKEIYSLEALRHKLRLLTSADDIRRTFARPVPPQIPPATTGERRREQPVCHGPPATGQTAVMRRPVTCHRCGKEGHLKRECRAPQYATNQRNQAYGSNPNFARPPNNGRNHLANKGTWHPYTKSTIQANKVEPMLPQPQRALMLEHGTDASTNKPDFKPYPPFYCVVFLNGKEVEAIIDTGATMTFVDADLYLKTLRRPGDKSPEESAVVVQGAANLVLKQKGAATIDIEYLHWRIASKRMTLKVMLIEGLATAALIGLDFLTLAEIQLDIARRQISSREIRGADVGRQPAGAARRASNQTFSSATKIKDTPTALSRVRPGESGCGGKNGVAEGSSPPDGREIDGATKAQLAQCRALGQLILSTTIKPLLLPNRTDGSNQQHIRTRWHSPATSDGEPEGGRNLDPHEDYPTRGLKRRHESESTPTRQLGDALKRCRDQATAAKLNSNTDAQGLGATSAQRALDDAARSADTSTVVKPHMVIPRCDLAVGQSNQLGTDAAPIYEADDVWGEAPLDLPQPFGDDFTEDRMNPYIFKEETQSLELDDGQAVEVGAGLTKSEIQTVARTIATNRDILAFDGRLGHCISVMHEIL